MAGRAVFFSIAVVAAVVGAHSLNPRELYNEMYPVSTMKRDAFHICGESNPTFIRAVEADRQACFESMPHAIAIALGLARPGGALDMAALVDPSRQAELLMMLAGMPPRQPITTRRSFSDTAWLHALPSPCDDKSLAPPAGYGAVASLPPPPGTGRATALARVVADNLPAGPRGAEESPNAQPSLPVIPLADGKTGSPVGGDKQAAASLAPMPAPDVGDSARPAIVPVAPPTACGA